MVRDFCFAERKIASYGMKNAIFSYLYKNNDIYIDRKVWRFFMIKRRILALLISFILIWSCVITTNAQVTISAPSAILIEASTGQVIYELNATERRSPASITKIMTILLIFEALEKGNIALTDDVTVTAHASSMGGSQVYLAEGEVQDMETLLKCIIVASANDASVAVAEHIAGSESAFVDMMNDKAGALGMSDTHFTDCCGLTDSDEHYTTAKDVAIMSRELIVFYPAVFEYTKIWMEDFTHVTPQGSSTFGLSSTNKLLKQYDWITGLKTGSTSKAKYCISATGNKNGMELIAVVMGAEDPKKRFSDAATLLNYGYGMCKMYVDENKDELAEIAVRQGVDESLTLVYGSVFRYLDMEKRDMSRVEKVVEIPETVRAPVLQGTEVGQAVYRLDGAVIGSVPILAGEDIAKAGYKDCFLKLFLEYLM